MKKVCLLLILIFICGFYLDNAQALESNIKQDKYAEYWQLGERYFSISNYDASIVFYKKAENCISNTNIEMKNMLYYNLAYAYYNITDYKNCKKYALLSYKNGGDTIPIIEFIADSSYNLGEYKNAEKYYKLALSKLDNIKSQITDKEMLEWYIEKERKYNDILNGNQN